MDYAKHAAKNQAVTQAEMSGLIADSIDVRVALIERMNSGELAPEQVLAELKRLRRGAARNGQTTRARAYRRA